MKKQTDLILPKFWLQHKPYNTIASADTHYIRCANGVLDILSIHKEIPLVKLFQDPEDLKHLGSPTRKANKQFNCISMILFKKVRPAVRDIGSRTQMPRI
jgi:hypothetical protein